MSKVWFTSDTHYGHKGIVRALSDWEDKETSARDFKTVEEMNDLLVEKINSVVQPNDVLFHLGDWAMGNIAEIWNFRKRLKVRTIHLILGNHDDDIESNKWLPNVIERPESTHIIDLDKEVGRAFVKGKWLVDGIAPKPLPSKMGTRPTLKLISATDLFTSVDYYKEVKVQGQRITLCHYPMRTWNKSHHGAWMLYGHEHGALTPDGTMMQWLETDEETTITTFQTEWKYYKTMDVGVDTNNYLPYSFEQIAEIMKDRVKTQLGHHRRRQ